MPLQWTSFTWSIAVAGFYLLFIALPETSLAFRTPDVPQKERVAQTTDSSGRTQKHLSSLQAVAQHNLKHSTNGAPVQTALQLADKIINGDRPQVSGSGTTPEIKTRPSRATRSKVRSDELSFQHIRISQEYKGLPVVGAELIVHVNDQDLVYMINGTYQPPAEINTEPVFSAENALQTGLDEQRDKINIRIAGQPALVIYDSRLAWYYVIEHDGTLPGQWRYYVDARDGHILNRYNNIQFAAPIQAKGVAASVSGERLIGEDGTSVSMLGFWESNGNSNYFLYNFENLWGIYDEDAADWEQLGYWNWESIDQEAVSCAENFENIQHHVSTVLGRNSFDNNSAFAKAIVHGGTNLVNAYWTGTSFYFGDGDGITANALTVLDVMGHEYGHALTQYTSNLVYQDESGALNEAYSDIYGTAVEFANQIDGTAAYPDTYAGRADWLVGEDAWLSETAARDMRNPQRYNQPSFYHGTYWEYGPADNGGVHTNSGVANFAFYLLAEGGSGTNDGHPYTISGIGRQAAAAVALRANFVYHTSTAQYADARTAWIQAAEDLGYNAQTVAAAWAACGVGRDRKISLAPVYLLLSP